MPGGWSTARELARVSPRQGGAVARLAFTVRVGSDSGLAETASTDAG